MKGKTLNIKGINSQGDNIGDNWGVKEALLAYNTLTKRSPFLPGLKAARNNLFWLSGAWVWCINRRPADLKKPVTRSYSPNLNIVLIFLSMFLFTPTHTLSCANKRLASLKEFSQVNKTAKRQM